MDTWISLGAAVDAAIASFPEFKEPTHVLAAAYDAGDCVLMASAILAHPLSGHLGKPSLDRCFAIAYKAAPVTDKGGTALRAVAKAILDEVTP